MKVLFDANVVLDWLMGRQPNAEPSTKALREAIRLGYHCLFPASSVNDIYYVMRKEFQNKALAKERIADLLSLLSLAPVTQKTIGLSLSYNGTDFEDDIIVATAVTSEVDCVVTNNISDFSRYPFMASYTPTQFLANIQ